MSGNSLGALRAEIKPGVREIHLCKDERGKTGLRLQAIDKVGLGGGGGGGGGEGPRGTQREIACWTAPACGPSCPREPRLT